MFSKLCRKEKFLFDFLLHFIGLVESFLEIGKKEKVQASKISQSSLYNFLIVYDYQASK